MNYYYCLSTTTTSFFLLFLSLLLSNDAQARVFPGMSSLVPLPSSTISSPQTVMEITRSSSSSILEIKFEVIGWITSPKAASTADQQQQVEQIITIPSTSSSLVSPPRGPWLPSVPAPSPAHPPKRISVHPPPIRPSPKSDDQMIDWISSSNSSSTTTPNESVISMIKHPQNDNLQAS